MKTKIIPVIHVIDSVQVLTNIETCIACGIDSVFLISHHSLSHDALIQLAEFVKTLYPDMWVGVNLLGKTTKEAIEMDLPVDGLWCDASISKEDSLNRKFKGLFFGGLAFKYQPQPKDLESACLEASETTDVACTSGTGTGKAPTTTKIQNIREYIGNHPVAIASGVSVDNFESFKDLVDYVLVASSITDKGELINEKKLKELVALNG